MSSLIFDSIFSSTVIPVLRTHSDLFLSWGKTKKSIFIWS